LEGFRKKMSNKKKNTVEREEFESGPGSHLAGALRNTGSAKKGGN